MRARVRSVRKGMEEETEGERIHETHEEERDPRDFNSSESDEENLNMGVTQELVVSKEEWYKEVAEDSLEANEAKPPILRDGNPTTAELEVFKRPFSSEITNIEGDEST
ncbi:hypothetical protein Scep_001478 [Stephania cephalantha]|uniref:Uncharacterized protein n=1 Tax=Stephania cephalantha TaxID=152367 RepID=A0AAP0L800_9MAGN